MMSFNLEGKMGHFRKFYTTVTSLSYAFPPRNTICGTIAAILGLERDSYYDLLSRDRCKIGIQILEPVKKVLLTTNYLDTDEISFRRLRGIGMKPTRVEYLFSDNDRYLRYKIYFVHEDNKIMDELSKRVKSQKIHYPISLGPAHCLAQIADFEEIEPKALVLGDKTQLGILTVIQQDQIVEIDPKLNEGKRIIIEERVPPDFGVGRKPISSAKNYLYEAAL